MPIKNAGPTIIKLQDNIYHETGSDELDIIILVMLKPVYSNPARIKTIPPSHSCFQDIRRTTSKIKTGRLCINNPSAHSRTPLQLSNTSKENIAKKSRNKIERTRGVQ
jgi:hypothetical protein